MIDQSINLLEELDNVSRIHILDRDDIDALMLEFARRIVATLKIERVNVWLFNKEKDSIVSIGEYDLRTQKFIKGSVFNITDYPAYFESIKQNRLVLAPNVYKASHTKEFSKAYSEPNEIISLMDVPLRMEGELIGVICFEKTGKVERNFNDKEQTFALSIATVLASSLEARARRAAQTKLEAAIKEKELLIQEINHRVKNNFTILISLLRLSRQKGRVVSPETILEEYEQRIFSMLKIQELLYQTKNYTSVNLSDYVIELVNEFKNSHPEVAPHVKTSVKHSEGHIPSKAAINLGLIITEIFLNSVKHAYGKTKDYVLEISLVESDEQFKLILGGPGNAFDFEKNLGDHNLGLHLVKGLSGDINLVSKFPTLSSPYYEFGLKKAE